MDMRQGESGSTYSIVDDPLDGDQNPESRHVRLINPPLSPLFCNSKGGIRAIDAVVLEL
jgi:hypothetical protein